MKLVADPSTATWKPFPLSRRASALRSEASSSPM
jgi:hypothetical protein